MSSFADAGQQHQNGVGGTRNSSLLEHFKLSPGIKQIAADILERNARHQLTLQKRKQQQIILSQQRKRGNGRRKYHPHTNKRGTISMAEFKAINCSSNGGGRTSSRTSLRKSKGTEIKFKPFRFTNGTSSSRANNTFLYLNQAGRKVYKKDIHFLTPGSSSSSSRKNNKSNSIRKGKLLPSAYRITRDQRHAFFRAEQRHEALMKPWCGLNKRKYIRDKDRVATKWLNRSLPPKLINSLEKSKRGHLFDVLEIANECAYLKVQHLKTATVGNDYVQSLIDGVIYYTGEPSVLHHRAKKVQKILKKLSKKQNVSMTSFKIDDDEKKKKNENNNDQQEAIHRNDTSDVVKLSIATKDDADRWGDIMEDDDADLDGNEIESCDDANNDTFVEKNEDVDDNDFDFGEGNIDLQISSIDNKDNSVDMADFDDDDGDQEEEILQLAVKKTSSSTENNMEFDEKTMSWKAVGEKAQKEEEDMMAGFDNDFDDDDDDDDEDWGEE
jgi:hypothetical protein